MCNLYFQVLIVVFYIVYDTIIFFLQFFQISFYIQTLLSIFTNLHFEMVLNSNLQIPTAQELLKSIPNIKRKWKLKTSMQKWSYLYGIGKVSADLLWNPLFKENVEHVHWLCYFLFVYMIGVPLLSIYTIWYYSSRGHFEQSLASTCMATIIMGVCKKKMFFFCEID